jgi:catechol 2,3-dioxygenase-like lactoylglutathione lyase family enzyme
MHQEQLIVAQVNLQDAWGTGILPPLWLGIDHTAIVVRSTEESRKFYRDVLGCTVVGESENYGLEREHLNHVFGARLRIWFYQAKRLSSNGVGEPARSYRLPSNSLVFR